MGDNISIQYRDYSPNDLSKQNELFVLSFPETVGASTSSKVHHHWKFSSITHNPPSYEYVGETENRELLGYYAALPYPYVINKKPMTCAMVCDVMTHPNARGQGVFTNIGFYSTERLKEEGLAFTSGYPIRPEVIPGHIKVGWKLTLDLPMYVRVIKTTHFLPALKFLAPLIDTFVAVFNFLPALFVDQTLKVEILNRTDFLNLSDYDKFFKNWCELQKNYLVKDRPFIQWRTGAPATEYDFFIARKSGEICAVAIARRTTLKGIPSVAILDFMALENINLGELHQQIFKFAKSHEKHAVVMMLSSFWATQYQLMRNFFVRSPFVFKLIIKKLQNQIPDADLFTKNNWHLMWIDSDDL